MNLTEKIDNLMSSPLTWFAIAYFGFNAIVGVGNKLYEDHFIIPGICEKYSRLLNKSEEEVKEHFMKEYEAISWYNRGSAIESFYKYKMPYLIEKAKEIRPDTTTDLEQNNE